MEGFPLLFNVVCTDTGAKQDHTTLILDQQMHPSVHLEKVGPTGFEMSEDFNLANFTNPICDNLLLSGASNVDLIHNAKCSFDKDKLRILIQISNAIQGYCDVD